MLLISRFRTRILLLCLLIPPPGHLQVCWNPDPDSGAPEDHLPISPGPATMCALDPSTGLPPPNGTSTKAHCPTGDYSQGKIVCGLAPPDNKPKCCCENVDQTSACNNLHTLASTSKQLCSSEPLFKNSEWCKPPNVCVDHQGNKETCPERAVLMPYCKVDERTDKGQPLGCSHQPSHDCPLTQLGTVTGNGVVCGENAAQQDTCCCKANSVEPCNAMVHVCQVDRFKQLTGCESMTISGGNTSTNTTPSATLKPVPHKNGVGFNQPDTSAGGLLPITGILATFHLRY